MAVILLMAAGLAACATPRPRLSIDKPHAQTRRGPPPPGSTQGLRGTEKPYQIKGQWYYPHADPTYDETGVGSWYGEQFHNRRTANGEIFDMDLPTAAHKTLPLPSLVEVTNLDNGRRMTLRVNDRGPFVGDRIIDLSRAAADQLGYRRDGVARVRVRYLGPAPRSPFDGQRLAAASPPPSRPSRPLPPPAPAYAAAARVAPPEPDLVVAEAAASPPPTFGYRVQAGSFANRDNAERAALALSGAGPASVEPLARAGGVLYRVLVAAGGDEDAAWSVRDRVAALGFSDATLLRP